MKTFLDKLDRTAARWLNTMDSQLQQPVVQILTGEVFTHGTLPINHIEPEQPVQQTVKQADVPALSQAHHTDTPERETVRPPVLRKAAVSHRS